MAIRIEIAKLWNGKLELRIGDIEGSTQCSHLNKKEVLSEISDEIDNLLESKKEQNKTYKELDKFIKESKKVRKLK